MSGEIKGIEIVTIKENKLNCKTLLGRDGGSIIKFSADGCIKSVYKKVRLFENQKHFYWEKQAEQWLITLEGYKEIVKFTDLKILKIDHMITNGEQVDNPYYQTDSTGKIIRVVEEVTVCGRTPQGDLAFSRARVIADINGMLTKKIIKAAEYDDKLGSFCDFEGYKELKKTKSVFFLPINEQEIMGEKIILGYALDVSYKKAFELIRKHMDECDHEYKKVWSKAYRNAVKAHSAVGKYVVNPAGGDKNKTVDIGIVQWTNDFTADELQQIEDYKNTGFAAPPDFESFTEDEKADTTEMDQEELENFEEMEPVGDSKPTTKPVEGHINDERNELIEYIVNAKDVVSDEAYRSTMEDFKVTDLSKCTILTLKSIKTKLDNSLEG